MEDLYLSQCGLTTFRGTSEYFFHPGDRDVGLH